MSYATASEIYLLLKPLRLDFTEADVNAQWHAFATATVVGEILGHQLDPTDVEDHFNLLKNAEICAYLESASNNKQIEATFGNLKEETQGGVTRKYDTGMPMFFFATGQSRSFERLLSHKTWQMCMTHFVDACGNAHRKLFMGKKRFRTYGYVGVDNSDRGYNWDSSTNDESNLVYKGGWE